MKEMRKMYIVRMYREDGQIEEIHMYAPDDKTALINAEQGFERKFEFVGKDNQLEMKILEEKINE